MQEADVRFNGSLAALLPPELKSQGVGVSAMTALAHEVAAASASATGEEGETLHMLKCKPKPLLSFISR